MNQPFEWVMETSGVKTRSLEQTVLPVEADVTPSMRLYLPRVEARLRGITALKAMSQVR